MRHVIYGDSLTRFIQSGMLTISLLLGRLSITSTNISNITSLFCTNACNKRVIRVRLSDIRASSDVCTYQRERNIRKSVGVNWWDCMVEWYLRTVSSAFPISRYPRRLRFNCNINERDNRRGWDFSTSSRAVFSFPTVYNILYVTLNRHRATCSWLLDNDRSTRNVTIRKRCTRDTL